MNKKEVESVLDGIFYYLTTYHDKLKMMPYKLLLNKESVIKSNATNVKKTQIRQVFKSDKKTNYILDIIFHVYEHKE